MEYNIYMYENLLKQKLSEKRYIHSVNVAKKAVEITQKIGGDSQKAQVAGLLHDIMKEQPLDYQLDIINKYKFDLSKMEKSVPKLWHAISGAIYVKYKLGIEDMDIINAIRYHTTGKPNMTNLEKVIFVADFTSDEREYNGLQVIKDKLSQNIDYCVLECLSFSIQDLTSRKMIIHSDSFQAYNYYVDLLDVESEDF